MSVDLNNTFKYDKIIINLNSSNCLFNPINENKADYYINLVDPLKNIIYIKILKASVSTANTISNLKYNKFDPIYIAINDYDRSLSYIKNTQITTTSNYYIGPTLTNVYTSNIVFNSVNYFDLIPYSLTNHSDISYNQSSFDWSDPSVYILNPPEQNLKRFNIQIKDKNFNFFENSILIDFNLSICVYVIKNRV